MWEKERAIKYERLPEGWNSLTTVECMANSKPNDGFDMVWLEPIPVLCVIPAKAGH